MTKGKKRATHCNEIPALHAKEGILGPTFCLSDVESVAGRALTPEEWRKFRDKWHWMKIDDRLCERGFELIDDVLREASIEKAEDDEE